MKLGLIIQLVIPLSILFRKDRNCKGWGVVMYMRNTINANLRSDLTYDNKINQIVNSSSFLFAIDLQERMIPWIIGRID